MNFWKQLPNATRIYLIILLYLVLVFCGLFYYRRTLTSQEKFNFLGFLSRDRQTTETLLSSESPGEVGATETLSETTPWLRARTNIRVHDGPGVNYAEIAWLEDNQTAVIVGTNPDQTWWMIEMPYFASGRGWVSGEEVEVTNPDQAPVVGADGSLLGANATTEPAAIARAIANVNIRSGPDLRFQKLGTLELEQTAEIIGMSADGYWYLIKIPGTENIQGWISRDYVVVQNSDNIPIVGTDVDVQSTLGPGAAFLISGTRINVRAGPDITYAVIGQLEENQVAEIIGKSEDGLWWAIRYQGAENERGWVAAAYVDAKNASNVPVVR